MDNYPLIAASVLTDAGFKKTQFFQVGSTTKYDEMKTMVDNNVSSLTTLDGEFASMIIRLHYYDYISVLSFEQTAAGVYKLIFKTFAPGNLGNLIEDYING